MKLMSVRSSLFAALVALVAAGCSESQKSPPQGDGELIVPTGLAVAPRTNGNGVLALEAATLQKGPDGGELFAAIKNVGDTPACSPALSIEMFDASDQSLGVGLAGLLVNHFYQLASDASTTAACLGPGDVGMAAVTDLGSELEPEAVARVEYWFNYWNLEVVPIDGISITAVVRAPESAGVAYTGTLHNGFETPLDNPSVAIFPLNRVGRPLGVARSHGSETVAPGGTWDFETNTVTDAGVNQAAYSAGGG